MEMPSVSNSSPLALRKDHDSVENEKDFDPPIKKLKVDRDLAGEEDNTDSVPKVASLTEREGVLYKLFKRFKDYYHKEYDQEEDERRFRIFKENLERPPTTHSEFGINRRGFTDLSQEELDVFQPCSEYYIYCSTSVSDLEEFLDKHSIQSPRPKLTYY